jgi:hypothetical protein
MGTRVFAAARGRALTPLACSACDRNDAADDVRPTDTKANGTVALCVFCRTRYRDYLVRTEEKE